MPCMTRDEATNHARRVCLEAASELGRGKHTNARGFLDEASNTITAILAAPVKARKVDTVALKNPRYSQSLTIGLAILGLFPTTDELLSIADIADELDLTRSTTHRYCSTLVQLGQLEQPAGGGRKYRRVAA